MASIRPRQTRNGTVWQVLYRKPDGTQTSATYSKREDADWAREHLERYGRLPPDDEHHAGRTIADLLTHHIDHLTGIEERTRADYRRIAKRHLGPHVGAIPADQLTHDDVALMINALAREHAPKTVWNAHALLSHALTLGQRTGWVSGNVARGARLPRKPKKPIRVISGDDATELLRALDPHWRPFVAFLAGTGARFGEAIALEVGDVDLTGPRVHIIKAVKRRGTGTASYVGTTKTAESDREVALPPPLVPMLAPLVRGRRKRERLFLTPSGTNVDHAHFYERQWQPATVAAGLDRLRIHDLRHFHASWLIHQGIPLYVVQKRLGHKHYSTTADIYGHLMPDAQDAAARAAALSLPDLRALEG